MGEREELVQAGLARFGFLTEAGFVLEMESRDWRSVLAYCSEKIVLEIEYDWREQIVVVLVCRSDAGRRPGGYYRDAEDRPARFLLEEALRQAGACTDAVVERLRAVARHSGRAAMERQLEELALVVAETVDDLLATADSLFDS